MTPHHDATIRRRPDGSIDTDFYARRAALLRCAAQREEPARWIGSLGRIVARLARVARIARAPGPGFAWSRRSR